MDYLSPLLIDFLELISQLLGSEVSGLLLFVHVLLQVGKLVADVALDLAQVVLLLTLHEAHLVLQVLHEGVEPDLEVGQPAFPTFVLLHSGELYFEDSYVLAELEVRVEVYDVPVLSHQSARLLQLSLLLDFLYFVEGVCDDGNQHV